MFPDSIPNDSIPIASSNPNDFPKKKRGNRFAKLKQCKLDARRQQWLSQVKNNGSKDSRVEVVNERGHPIEEYNDGLVHNCSDFDSPANSPTSYTSRIMGGNDSGINLTGSSRSTSSSSNCGCCSASMSEDEEGGDGHLDDWEAVADALASTDEKKQHKPSLVSPAVQSIPRVSGVDKSGGLAPNRAWRSDDALRPQNLPNLAKQYSFPMNSDRGSVWVHRNLSVPTSCPICYEELDFTDTSFIPCSCGFKLCLFCHKKILEGDGRCPGCRKPYDRKPIEGETILDGGGLKFHLPRSCSMISRT